MTPIHYRKIAILGFTEHRRLAPFADPTWGFWCLNDLYLDLPETPYERVRWFQIHDWKRPHIPQRPPSVGDFSGGPVHPRDPNHVIWLAETAKHCPVYLMKPAPEVPDALILPRDELYAYFRDATGRPIKYFTNSISWMIALAIMELAPRSNGFRALEDATLGVWGVDMMVSGGAGSEYGWQRPSCEFLLGWAAGAGIKIHVPDESELLKTAWDYGDEQAEYFRTLLFNRRQQMSAQRGQVDGELQRLSAARSELSGWINCADTLLRNHLPGDPGDEPYLYHLGRAPVPDSHKAPLGPGLTNTLPFDNGEGNIG